MVSTSHRELVDIAVEGGVVEGLLALPEDPAGIVLFAHGSGSGRTSPRNNQVAAILRAAGLGTLLMDLLTEQEDGDTAARFNITLLASRLTLAAEWLAEHRRTASLPLGVFGASTGAAAAVCMAASAPHRVRALVSRGGRADLAGETNLASVQAPSLLIVGGLDTEVIELNRRAMAILRCERELMVVPGATHLFEEPGALDQVGDAAVRWFAHYLKRSS